MNKEANSLLAIAAILITAMIVFGLIFFKAMDTNTDQDNARRAVQGIAR